MRLQSPFAVVTPTLDGSVLGALAGADAEFTVSQIHDLVGEHTHHGVRKVVYRLVGEGIVLERSVGRNRNVYSLNRDHLCAAAILEIANTHARFLQQLRSSFAALTVEPMYAALFGSAARGEMAISSDIDILVVRPDGASDLWDEELAELTADASTWTGNDTRLLEFRNDELDDPAVKVEPVLSAIAREGITLSGSSTFLRSKGVR